MGGDGREEERKIFRGGMDRRRSGEGKERWGKKRKIEEMEGGKNGRKKGGKGKRNEKGGV